jgi:hypothetical protein
MADDFIQVPTDSTGKRVETNLLTRPDGVAVERQRVELPDLVRLAELLAEQLAEMRVTNFMLARMLDMGPDELLDIRADNLT